MALLGRARGFSGVKVQGETGVMGIAATVADPNGSSGAAAWPQPGGGNWQIIYCRIYDWQMISNLKVLVSGTPGGNIAMAVYDQSGSPPLLGTAARPGARLAYSGIIACPAAGIQTVALTADTGVTLPLEVYHGRHWFAMACDSATPLFGRVTPFSGSFGIGLVETQNITTGTNFPTTATTTNLGIASYKPIILGG